MKRKQKNQHLQAYLLGLLFFVLLSSVVFLPKQSYAVSGDYSKPINGTLAASEWNNLINDFVAKSGSRLDGYFSINTATSSTYALDIDGALRATSITGSYTGFLNAANISSGQFGSNAGYGNFSFPGNVGIGTTSPLTKLNIVGSGTTSATVSLLIQDGAGAEKMKVLDSGQALFNGTVLTSLPQIGFLSDTNTGLNWVTTDTVGLMAGGITRFSCSSGACGAAVPTTLTRLTTTLDVNIGTTLSAGRIGTASLNIGGNPESSSLAALEVYGGISAYSAPSGAVVFYDTFSGGVTEELSVHSPDTGTSWTRIIQNGSATASSRNTGFAGPTATLADQGVLYTADGSYPTADYEVSAYMHALDSSDDVLILAVRVQDSNNMYVARLSSSATGIYKMVGGTWTLVGSSAVYLVPGTYVKFRVIGNVLSLYRGDSLLLTVSDSSISSAGKAGLGFGRVGIITSDDHDATWQIDNFSVKLYESSSLAALFMNGNVGIGTTNPISTLDVDGLIKMRTALITADEDVVNKGYLDSALASSTGGIITMVASSSFWQGNMAGNIYNANTGNIGIGITNPIAKFHTVGSATASEFMALFSQNGITPENSTTGSTVQNKMLSIQGSGGAFFHGRDVANDIDFVMGTSIVGEAFAGAMTSHDMSLRTNNTNRLTVKATSGNVGIGTANPGALLEVNKNQNTLTLAGVKNTDTGASARSGIIVGEDFSQKNFIIQYLNSGWSPSTSQRANGAQIYANALATGGIDIATQNASAFITFTTGGLATTNERMRITGGGNVGIGTTTPGTRLTVVGSGNYSIDAGNFRVGNVATPVSALDAVNKSYFDSAVSAAQSAFWNLSGSNLFASSTSWNVGIGNNNPGAKLHVSGGNVVVDSNNYFKSGGSTSVSGGVLSWGTQNAAYGYDGFFGRGIYYDGSNYRYASTNAANYWGTNAGLWVKGSGNNALQFIARPATEGGTGIVASDIEAYSRMVISYAGNIGIGTTAPTRRLEVASSGAGTDIFAVTDSGNNLLFKVRENGGAYSEMYMYDSSHVVKNLFSTAGDSYITGGNVGIGTTNPTAKLYVNGTSIFNDVATFTQPVIVGAPVLNAHAATKNYVDSQISSSTGAIAFWGGSLGSHIWSLNSVNVGIGTSNPDTKLKVEGNTPVIQIRETTGNAEAGISINHAASGNHYNWFIGTLDGNARKLTIGSTVTDGHNTATAQAAASLFLIDQSSGSVGIGATNPLYKLDVTGDIRSTDRLIVGDYSNSVTNSGEAWLFRASDRAAGTLTVQLGGASAASTKFEIVDRAWTKVISSISGEAPGGSLVVQPTGNVTMMGGNVGIGTTTPGTRLTVVGSGNYSIDAGNYRVGNVATPVSALDAVNKSYFDSAVSAAQTAFWNLNGSNLYASSTSWNVGIGTTAPGAKLDINGDLKISGLMGKDLTQNYINMGSGGGDTVYSAGGSIIFDFGKAIAGSRHATFKYNGTTVFDFGLGGGYINGKLALNSTGVANSDLSFGSNWNQKIALREVGAGDFIGLGTISLGGTYQMALWGRTGSGVAADSTNYAISIAGRNVGIQVANAVNSLDVNGGLAVGSYAGVSSAPSNGVIISGNVGIGTTTPGTRLTVIGSGNYSIDAGNFRVGNVATPVSNLDAVNKAYLDSAVGAAQTAFWNLNGSNLYASSTNWNVGLGTTNPVQKLEIVGTATSSAIQSNISAFAGGGIRLGGGAANSQVGISYTAGGGGGAAIAFRRDGGWGTYMDFYTNNAGVNGAISPVMTMNSAGNVGIGTTNPTAKLYVNGTSIFNNVATFTQPVIVGAPVLSAHAATKNYVDSQISSSTGAIAFWGGSVGSNIWSLNSGNVGVGTNSPTQKLHVSGGNIFASNVYSRLILGRQSSDGDVHIGASGNGGPLNGGQDYGFYTAYNAYRADDGYWYHSRADVVGAYKFSGGYHQGGFTWSYAANQGASNISWTDLMRLTSSGNLGVGTASPNSRLHVYNTAANAEIDIQSLVGAGNHWGMYSNLSDNSYRIWGGSDYLTILRGGNVGIGTTNPGAYRLNVNGNTNITGNLNITGTTTAAAFVGPVVGTLNAANVSAGAFGASTGGGNYSFPGNVGIGTTTPSHPLDISFSADGNLGIKVSGTGATSYPTIQIDRPFNYRSSQILFSTAGTANWYMGTLYNGGAPNNSYSISTDSTLTGSKLVVTSAGNVGVGTTNPKSLFYLYGTNPRLSLSHNVLNAGDVGIDFLLNNNGTGEKKSAIIVTPVGSYSRGNMSFVLDSAADSNNYDYTTDTKLFIKNDGNVGIGTTDPGVYRLKVAGDMAITGTLQTQTGSDFAEEFSVTEDLSAGTVVVMSDEGHKSVKAAASAYDRTVVGIVSDNPSIIAGKVDSEKKVVVAMMGVVSVKASDSNGRIRRGDLLTSADLDGYAMKASEFKPGTIIGKALEDLKGSSGQIKVLVNLQ